MPCLFALILGYFVGVYHAKSEIQGIKEEIEKAAIEKKEAVKKKISGIFKKDEH